ncbi:MAG: hypothetical protein KJ072_25945 [Verrucomicrobia bacterium]|nr:hypothetical protein [Verrucomicrobiota bacterium]
MRAGKYPRAAQLSKLDVERPRAFFERAGLLVNHCGPDRHRALRHRLGELGLVVTRVVKQAPVYTVWEVNFRVDYVDQMPPPVGPFRARFRRALRALGYSCADRDIRIRLRADMMTHKMKMKMTFLWPEEELR